jgi:hypothetical protein
MPLEGSVDIQGNLFPIGFWLLLRWREATEINSNSLLTRSVELSWC